MKAAIFRSFGSVDVLEVVDIPTPSIGSGEILVNVKAASVNPKDIFIRKGYFKQFIGSTFPMQIGFDFSGEIIKIGKQISDFQIGESVFGMLGGWHGRTCAELLTVVPEQISRKPSNLNHVESAALPLVSLTALQALVGKGGITSGDRICINGASGGVGSMAVQIAKQFNAHITAICSKQNHAMLKSLGADVCIDYQDFDISRSQQQFDIFFDVFGNKFFEIVQPVLTPKGIWISTVLRPEVESAVNRTQFSTGQVAKQVFVEPDSEGLSLIRQWVEAGNITPVIHSVYNLKQIKAAHIQQESKHTRGKLVVDLSII